MSRPFKINDRASLKWGSVRFRPGTIASMYEFQNRAYARLVYDDGNSQVFPLHQLVPTEKTRWALRHILYSINLFVIIMLTGNPMLRKR